MYTVAKAPNAVFSKTRFHGLNGGGKYNGSSISISETKSISPPSGSRSPDDDATRRSSSVESLTNTGPRPVFFGSAKKDLSQSRRRARQDKASAADQRQRRLPQSHQDQHLHHQQQTQVYGHERPRPDAEIISFFERSWSRLNAMLEATSTATTTTTTTTPASSLSKATPSRPAVVHYSPSQPIKLPDFVPCNYERVWADHQHQKLIRNIDLSLQLRSQSIEEGKCC